MSDASASADSRDFQYRWFAFGDLNGFFGIMFDNVTVLAFLAFILINIFDMPGDIVYGKIFPGTAFGVLVGDLIYTWLAFVQAKRQKRNVTAMPLGLDTPSTIGIAFTVLGPAFISYKNAGMSPHDAAMQTWYVGMACMIYCGLMKTFFSFFGNWISKVVPQAGLMGSLAGVGIALLGVVPIIEIMSAPLVGLVALGIVLYNMVAGIKLPYNMPGVFISVVVGTILYYIFGAFGLVGLDFQMPSLSVHVGFPWPTVSFINGLKDAINYLPVIIPFTILTVVGGINVTESARLAGDEYKTHEILLVEAFSTFVAGFCGGVAQTTPYIGQPSFKKMGCRAGYTVLTGVFVGICGILGIIQFIVDAVPTAALAPILCFVGIEMVAQTFVACIPAHYPAVALAFIPNIARVIAIKGNYSEPGVFEKLIDDLMTNPTRYLDEKLVIPALGNGFIFTAMLWGAFFALMIDRKLRESSIYLMILAILSLFGIIHSVEPSGNMYLPWNLENNVLRAVPYQFFMGYFILSLLLLALSLTKEAQEVPEHLVGEAVTSSEEVKVEEVKTVKTEEAKAEVTAEAPPCRFS
ncbi:hypothetical protein IJT10_07870 [bacterium]|nr:hypothetical protein [bacterium]